MRIKEGYDKDNADTGIGSVIRGLVEKSLRKDVEWVMLLSN